MESTGKRRSTGPVVFTANRLRDGRAVWLAAGDRWSESIADAELYEGEAVELARARADAWAKRQIVVGPYDIAVEPGAAAPSPVTMRERIRALGPSVGPDSAQWRAAE
ncbi:MAG TPA: DUF2849 domain-containing protein [Alphaproteobacteria bacterium]|nr:DUF2849 domain-containing protein [Alphaproteobacteria bacterium]